MWWVVIKVWSDEERLSGWADGSTLCRRSKLAVNVSEPRRAGAAMSAGEVSPKPPLRSGKEACVHACPEGVQPRI